MKQIRNGIFETNSSSTHTLTMCMKDDYNDWINGKAYFDLDTSKIKSAELVKEEFEVQNENKKFDNWRLRLIDEKALKYKEDGTLDYCCWDYDNLQRVTEYDAKYLTFKEYWDMWVENETYESEFETPSGEKIIAFGDYGQDQ